MEEIKSSNYIKTNILKGRALNNIILYNENGEILNNGRGWLELQNGYPDAVEGFNLNQVRKAIKKDFTKKDNFYISTKNYLNEPSFDLFIYCGEGGDFEIIKEVEFVSFENEGETHFAKSLTIKNKNGFFITKLEKSESPEAIKNNGFLYVKKTVEEITVKKHLRIEYTEERAKTDKFRRELNEKYNFSLYSNKQLKELFCDLKKFYNEK